MNGDELYRWLIGGARRTELVLRLHQPATARQIAKWLDVQRDTCSAAIWELRVYGLLRCLNEPARRSRVYWLTRRGLACQQRLLRSRGRGARQHGFPLVDWRLYGWVCFRHRAAVIKALVEPLRPAAIKRRAAWQDVTLRMSANNVRDIIRLFLAKEIVRPLPARRRRHPRYELTEVGRELQTLLLAAEHPSRA